MSKVHFEFTMSEEDADKFLVVLGDDVLNMKMAALGYADSPNADVRSMAPYFAERAADHDRIRFIVVEGMRHVKAAPARPEPPATSRIP